MKDKALFDISEVCDMLGITSRALRFYEEKGLVSSTREFSNRRKYSKEQIEIIKKILVLRTLGLNISQIKKIQDGDNDLKQAIIEHKSKIIATIVSKSKEIKLLDEAMRTLESDGDIFCAKFDTNELQIKNKAVADITDKFILGNYELVFNSFSEVLQAYTPLSAFERIVQDTLSPLGEFVSIDAINNDATDKSVFYSYLKYEKLGLRIKFVMYENSVHGFWLTYYEI